MDNGTVMTSSNMNTQTMFFMVNGIVSLVPLGNTITRAEH